MLSCFTPNISPHSLVGILYGQSFGPHFLVIGRSVFRPIDSREPLLSPAPRLSSVDLILCKILFVDCSVDYSVSGTCLRRFILFRIFVWSLFRLQLPVLGLVASPTFGRQRVDAVLLHPEYFSALISGNSLRSKLRPSFPCDWEWLVRLSADNAWILLCFWAQ